MGLNISKRIVDDHYGCCQYACFFPVYYTPEALKSFEIIVVQRVWHRIMESSPPSNRADCNAFCSMKEWFLYSFYARLLDVHPYLRDACKTMNRNKDFMIYMINQMMFLVSQNRHRSKLRRFAQYCIKKGVKIIEFAVLGEVLLWTLSYTLGPSFCELTRTAWIKGYSRVLDVVIPEAFLYASQKKRKEKDAIDLLEIHFSVESQVTSKPVACNVSETKARVKFLQRANSFFQSSSTSTMFSSSSSIVSAI